MKNFTCGNSKNSKNKKISAKPSQRSFTRPIQEENIILNLKKNILRIAISVFHIGENDNRQTKNCYIWKHKYTREGEETLLRNLHKKVWIIGKICKQVLMNETQI